MLRSVKRLRSPPVRLAVVAVAIAAAFAAGGCFVEPGQTCCTSDFQCVAGMRCFEGTCSLSCDDDGQCAEGEGCVGVGVCRLERRDVELQRCAYEQGRSGEGAGG